MLPLGALALLSTLFLFNRSSGNGSEIPFAELDELAREQQITAPEFSGITREGAILQIAASSAQPQNGDLQTLVITRPRLTLESPDGTTLQIEAGEGAILGPEERAHLSGLARLETSSGYLMETTALRANLATGEITSDGHLEVRAPFGSLTAGRVTLKVANDGSGQQMHFTDGIKMIYTPAERTEEN